MAAWLEEPKPGQPIAAEWAVALVRAINGLIQDGPEVVAPLAKFEGAIYLAQDYQIYWATTTGTITARAGTQWGSGMAKFLTLSAAGVESVAPGAAAVKVWSPFGAPISANIRVGLAWTYEKWVVQGGDCSGVA